MQRKNSEFKFKIGDIVQTKHSKIKITDTYKKNGYKYYVYVCLDCGNKDKIREDTLTKGSGCNVCCPTSQKVVKEINSVWGTSPELVKYFVNEEDSWKYTVGSHEKVWFKCTDCGNEHLIAIRYVCKYGFNCNKCGDSISYPNKFAYELLNQLKINFETEYNPIWIKPKRYDFYFELGKNKYILEMDGEWHIKDNNMSGQSAVKSKAIDDYKDKMAKEHGIEVIRIDCNESKLDYIKNNIITSDLLQLIDLSNIDWLQCHEFACHSLVKVACDYWNNYKYTTKEISKTMNLCKDTISKYLTQGKQLSWCNYNAQEEIVKGRKKSKKGNKIICVENKMIFKSLTECERQSFEIFGVKLHRQYIANSCITNKSYHELHFKYA